MVVFIVDYGAENETPSLTAVFSQTWIIANILVYSAGRNSIVSG